MKIDRYMRTLGFVAFLKQDNLCRWAYMIWILDFNWSAGWDPWGRNELKVGAPVRRKAPEIFFIVSLHFLALNTQLVVLVNAFVVDSTVWSVSCLLFFFSRCPRAQLFVKLGARAPPLLPGAAAQWQWKVEKGPTTVNGVSYVHIFSRIHMLLLRVKVNVKA